MNLTYIHKCLKRSFPTREVSILVQDGTGEPELWLVLDNFHHVAYPVSNVVQMGPGTLLVDAVGRFNNLIGDP